MDYNDLRARGAIPIRIEWTDASTPALVTPDFPGTIGPGRTRLKGDVAWHDADVSAIRDLAGNPISLPKHDVHYNDYVTTSSYAGLQTKRIAAEPTGADHVTSDSEFVHAAAAADVWLRKPGVAWEVLRFHLENGPVAAVKYEFVDEAGTPATVFGPCWLNAYDHRDVDTPFKVTGEDRLYLRADKAGAGSLTIWVKRTTA